MEHVTGNRRASCKGTVCSSVISMCNHMESRESIPHYLNPNTGNVCQLHLNCNQGSVCVWVQILSSLWLWKRVRSDGSRHNGEKQRKRADGNCQTPHIRCISHINLLLHGQNMYALETTPTLVKTLVKKKKVIPKGWNHNILKKELTNNSHPFCFKPVWLSSVEHKKNMMCLLLFFYAITKNSHWSFQVLKMKQNHHKCIIKVIQKVFWCHTNSFVSWMICEQIIMELDILNWSGIDSAVENFSYGVLNSELILWFWTDSVIGPIQWFSHSG